MKWTTEKIEELRRRYPHEDNARLAQDFGCSRKALVFRASHLGLRKTDAANEARYAAMSRRHTPESLPGECREIATGTLIVRGNVITHLSRFAASREQGRAEAGADAMDDASTAANGSAANMPRKVPHITCPHCKARFTPPAAADSLLSYAMEA